MAKRIWAGIRQDDDMSAMFDILYTICEYIKIIINYEDYEDKISLFISRPIKDQAKRMKIKDKTEWEIIDTLLRLLNITFFIRDPFYHENPHLGYIYLFYNGERIAFSNNIVLG